MASGFPSQGLTDSNYAGIGARIGAYLIDHLLTGVATIPGWIVILIFAVIFSAGASNESGAAQGVGGIGMVLGYLLVFVGAIGFLLFNVNKLGKTGMTIGKKIMKIKVVTATGEPLGFGKAFLREIVKGLAGSICPILLLWPMWDQEQQSLGDKVVGTHVYPA